MTKGIVGSMSKMGWITEPPIKAAKKIDYWFASRKNQGIVIPEVESFQFVRESAQGTQISIDEFCERLGKSLERVLLECFETVTIETRSEDVSSGGSMFRCFFSGTVYENGVGYDISKAVLFNNKSYEKINEGRHGS